MSPAIIEKPQPLYPGAAILMTRFQKNGVIGDVRVQDFSEVNYPHSAFKVCKFLPGIVECSPGDTPKVWPEIHQHVATWDEACDVFERFVDQVRHAGWTELEDDDDGA